MGDRADCTLTLKGLLQASHIDMIAENLDDQYAQTHEEDAFDDTQSALRAGENEFEFSQMNYAQMPQSLQDALKAAKLSYTWIWQQGDEYGEGVIIYDAFTDTEVHYRVHGGDIVLSLDQIKDPQKVADAFAWEKIYAINEFEIFTSNHDLLKHQAEGRIDERFFELHKHSNSSLISA